MFSKVVKNLRWRYVQRKFRSCGTDCRIGVDFTVHGAEYIILGDGFRGGKHVIIDAYDSYNGKPTSLKPLIVIGNQVTLTDFCYISCINQVCIGDGTLLGQNTFIGDNYHGQSTRPEMDIPPNRRKLYSKGKIQIGRNVWIGKNTCVMPGVTIGDGVVIGANSVVTHDIPNYSIAVGVPARVIRQYEAQ